MQKDDFFESERLNFRGINETDAVRLAKWRSDLEVIRYFYSPSPITLESHLCWYHRSYLQDKSRFDFIITEKASGNDIGFVSIKDVCQKQKSGEISYTIAEKEFQKRGYAKEAILALMAYLQPEITTVYADIHQENLPSIRTVKALGFLRDNTCVGPFVRYRREYL